MVSEFLTNSVEKSRIDSLTHGLIQDVNGSNHNFIPPIQLGELLEKYKISLQAGVFTDSDIVGVYEKKQRKIIVAESELDRNKFFIIAHKMGHFFLHNEKMTDVMYKKDLYSLGGSSSIEEAEANWFAASILMPQKSIGIIWPMVRRLDEMAARFMVAEPTAFYRLNNLGLLQGLNKQLGRYKIKKFL